MKKTMCIVLLLLINILCKSQSTALSKDLYENIRKVNNSSAICYDYKMFLKNGKTQKYEDSLIGKLYRVNGGYLDSNKYTVATCNKEYYCKLDFSSKTAIVINVSSLKKKMRAKKQELNGTTIDLSDSLVAKYGTNTEKTLKNGNKLIHIAFRNQSFTNVDVEVRATDYHIVSLCIEFNERSTNGELSDYLRVYRIFNLQYKVNESVLKQDRFYTIANQKISLSPKYSHFHLSTLTN